MPAFAVFASCGPQVVKDVLCRLLEATTAAEVQFVSEFLAKLQAGEAIKPIGETEIVIDTRGVLRTEDVVVMVALVKAGAFDSDAQLLVESHICALGSEVGSSSSSRDHTQAGVDSNGMLERKTITGLAQVLWPLCYSQSVGQFPCM